MSVVPTWMVDLPAYVGAALSVTVPPPANVIPPVPVSGSAMAKLTPALSIVPPFGPTTTSSLLCEVISVVVALCAFNVPPSKLTVAKPEPAPCATYRVSRTPP